MSPKIPQQLTRESAKCNNCGAISYQEIALWWPEDPTLKPPCSPMTNVYYNRVDSAFHVNILTCVGCKKQEVRVYPNGVGVMKQCEVVWPRSSRPFPNLEFQSEIPKAVINDFLEAAGIENLSPAASATLSRRCLQAILKSGFPNLIGTSDRLKNQVEGVLKANILPSRIADELHSIRSIGNSATHPNIDPSTNEIVEVQLGEASACLDVLEDLIDHVYVKPLASAKRKTEREKKYGSDSK